MYIKKNPFQTEIKPDKSALNKILKLKKLKTNFDYMTQSNFIVLYTVYELSCVIFNFNWHWMNFDNKNIYWGAIWLSLFHFSE